MHSTPSSVVRVVMYLHLVQKNPLRKLKLSNTKDSYSRQNLYIKIEAYSKSAFIPSHAYIYIFFFFVCSKCIDGAAG